MSQCPILMYHWFRAGGARSASLSPQLEITPELFDRQLDWLTRRGYHSVSLAQALGCDGDTPAGRGRIVITFDDGTIDFWEHARPILKNHGFSATLFVVAGEVGGSSTWDRDLGEPDRPLLSWDQIRELHREGFEIGSHTCTHRPLTDLPDEEARDEMTRSRQILAQELGVAPLFLAYPRGEFADRHKRMAREAGYAGACAVIRRWGELWRSDRYALKRMTVKGTESMLRFRMRVAACRLVRQSD